MKRKLFKINKNDSVAVCIPKQLVAAMGLKPGDDVAVHLGKSGEIVIERITIK